MQLQQLETLHKATDKLLSYLEKESLFLKERRGREISQLSAEKEIIVGEYMRIKSWIMQNKNFIDTISTEQRQSLLKKTERLLSLAESNERALSALSIASQKFLNKFKEKMGHENQLNQTYTAKGYKMVPKNFQNSFQALTINESM